jgi:hypothetical protein
MLSLFRRTRIRNTNPAAFRFCADVIVHVHEAGAVFLHSKTGVVYSCNPVGAKLWSGVRSGRPVREMAAELAREYSVSAEVVAHDAGRFIGELESAGILGWSGDEGRM